MRWILSTLLAVIVTVGAVYVGRTIVPWPAVVDTVAGSRPIPLIVAALLVPLIQWVRAWRFSILLRGTIGSPGGPVLRATVLAVALNALLPFRIGELGFPLLLRRYDGTPILRGAGVLALVRLWDLALVCTVGSALILVVHPPPDMKRTLIVLALGLGAGFFTFRLPWAARRLVQAIRSATRHYPRLDAVAERLAVGLQSLHARGPVLAGLAATSTIWLLHVTIGILVAASGPIPIDHGLAALATLAGTLAFALPINGIAAIGPTHAAWTATLTFGGVPLDLAVATGILWHALLVASSMVLGTIAVLWPRRAPC